MAFDFLGTLSQEKLRELKAFLEVQIEDIAEQINFLLSEKNTLEQTLNNFIKVYEQENGANSISKQIEEISKMLPDKVVVPKQDDSVSCNIMTDIKKPFISTIKFKKERNEFKIKKLFDAIEQDKELIDRKSIAKSQTMALIQQIENMFNNSNENFLFSTEDKRKNYLKGIFS